MLTQKDLDVATLGECRFVSPLRLSVEPGDGMPDYTPEGARVPLNMVQVPGRDAGEALCFEKAGPRARVFFDPKKVYAAIVTCGGLCPGLNNVIQSVFLELYHNYGVSKVLGVRYGLSGFDPGSGLEPVDMTPAFVDGIQEL
ncbi:MAG TPA: ATP-dependent 6-phosphofructokinase, partial [Candidatus Glassbacteria bacterium]|nr:ATP-dependent 6-phosphofructokinase [Candidatus Glassbacteria bacterium]